MFESGREALQEVRKWSAGPPDVQEWSGDPPGCQRMVFRPSWMSGSSREALQDVL